MGKTSYLICILLFFFLIQPEVAAAVAVNSNSSPQLSLKLIHKDSIFSPSYPGNLTASEWFRRQVDHTKSHVQRLESSIMVTPDDYGPVARPQVIYHGALYQVMVGIGTPPINYYLILDTGSDLTWTECAGCDFCHAKMNKTFDPKNSSTYASMRCDDIFCKPPYYCLEGKCVYDVTYAAGANVGGELARDSFSFPSDEGQEFKVNKFAFGCTLEATNQFFDGYAAGVLGLGAGDLSFGSQLVQSFFNTRFSYCLIGGEAAQTKHSYLRFGRDITIEDKQTIPFSRPLDPSLFYLDLLDISVDRMFLLLPPGTYSRKPDGSGGFIIDSGSTVSILQTEPYEKLTELLTQYFEAWDLKPADPADGHGYPTDLCYEIPPDGFTGYPTINFHFETADLSIDPMQVFYINEEAKYFCLAMVKSSRISVLGAMQQANYRFMYDIGRDELSFSREDCSAESG